MMESAVPEFERASEFEAVAESDSGAQSGFGDQAGGSEAAGGPAARFSGHCRRCGYGLHDLSSEQSCPECGVPVAWSAAAPRLAFRPPEFVRRLRMAAFAVGGTLLLTAALWLGLSLSRGLTPANPWVTVYVSVSAVCGLVGLMGWWMLVSRDPAMAGRPAAQDPWSRPRRGLRAAVLMVVTAWTVRPLVFNLAGGGTSELLTHGLAELGVTLLYWYGLRHLARIADEIPRPRTASRIRRASLIVLIVQLICSPIQLAYMMGWGVVIGTFTSAMMTGVTYASLVAIVATGLAALRVAALMSSAATPVSSAS
jgi:hypothetical protein